MRLLQERVQTFVDQHALQTSLELRLLDLASEVGELAKEVLIASDYGKRDFSTSDAFQDEQGDVFFSLICVANEAGVEMEGALEHALSKYARRFAEGLEET